MPSKSQTQSEYWGDVMFSMITSHCQFVEGKTSRSLSDIEKYIAKVSYAVETDNISNNEVNNSKGKLVNIVVTNKSLLETKQFQIRAKNKFINKNIHILSSKSDQFNNISDYTLYLQKNINNEDNFPNILIMCFHPQRICDIITLLDMYSSGWNYNGTTIHFNLYFDEPDANKGVLHKFLKNMHKNKDHVEKITFITATASKDFWNIPLHKNKIYSLDKLKPAGDFKELMSNYTHFNLHTFIHPEIRFNASEFHDKLNPLEFFQNIHKYNLLPGKELRVYCPASQYKFRKGTGSHEEMAEYAISCGYTVLLLNGDFKGFIYPTGGKQTLEEFKEQYGLGDCELYDILKRWNRAHRKQNLLITGHHCIERGMTFNTKGFQLTHIILGPTVTNQPSVLEQMAGRGSGAKQYCKPCTFILLEKTKKSIQEGIDRMNDIMRNDNLEELRSDDFVMNDGKTIPVKGIIPDSDTLQKILEILISAKKSLTKRKKTEIHRILSEGHINGKVRIIDNNRDKFNFDDYSLKTVRKYRKDDPGGAVLRRFKNFNENHCHLTKMIQGGLESEQYCIDFAQDRYEHNGYVNETNVFWITYKTRIPR